MQTPNGRLTFLQLVGVTAAEKERMVASSTSAVLAELAAANPLLVTDRAGRDPSRALAFLRWLIRSDQVRRSERRSRVRPAQPHHRPGSR
jgi:hypothetical protein